MIRLSFNGSGVNKCHNLVSRAMCAATRTQRISHARRVHSESILIENTSSASLKRMGISLIAW
jgi:hypothetical protein